MTRWESRIDKQIREAEERGDFANLPGAGKPLADIGEPYDENWWVKGLLRRENMPDQPALRKEVEALPERLAKLKLESSVRDIVTDLNNRIRNDSGGTVAPVDLNAAIAAWKATRARR
jgi:Domain of unknown function (DUF1992)